MSRSKRFTRFYPKNEQSGYLFNILVEKRFSRDYFRLKSDYKEKLVFELKYKERADSLYKINRYIFFAYKTVNLRRSTTMTSQL